MGLGGNKVLDRPGAPGANEVTAVLDQSAAPAPGEATAVLPAASGEFAPNYSTTDPVEDIGYTEFQVRLQEDLVRQLGDAEQLLRSEHDGVVTYGHNGYVLRDSSEFESFRELSHRLHSRQEMEGGQEKTVWYLLLDDKQDLMRSGGEEGKRTNPQDIKREDAVLSAPVDESLAAAIQTVANPETWKLSKEVSRQLIRILNDMDADGQDRLPRSARKDLQRISQEGIDNLSPYVRDIITQVSTGSNRELDEFFRDGIADSLILLDLEAPRQPGSGDAAPARSGVKYERGVSKERDPGLVTDELAVQAGMLTDTNFIASRLLFPDYQYHEGDNIWPIVKGRQQQDQIRSLIADIKYIEEQFVPSALDEEAFVGVDDGSMGSYADYPADFNDPVFRAEMKQEMEAILFDPSKRTPGKFGGRLVNWEGGVSDERRQWLVERVVERLALLRQREIDRRRLETTELSGIELPDITESDGVVADIMRDGEYEYRYE